MAIQTIPNRVRESADFVLYITSYDTGAVYGVVVTGYAVRPMNGRIQMRQINVDFQNRELPTNILARLLVTTRRPQSEWREGDTVLSPEQSGDDEWRAAA